MASLFDDLLKKEKKESETEPRMALLVQTEKCKSFVLQTFRFGGLAEPKVSENTEEFFKKLKGHTCPIVIELPENENVFEYLDKITHQLSSENEIVLLGYDNSISTQRKLAQEGYYYLFLPSTDDELLELLKKVKTDISCSIKIGKKRAAKRVSVLGVKGGVGSSFVCASIASAFTLSMDIKTLLVEYKFASGNLDIFLAKKNLKKREVSSAIQTAIIDESYARTFVEKVNPNLSYLGITSKTITSNLLLEYTELMTKEIASDYRVIIKDYSNAVMSPFEVQQTISNSECLVLVFDATLSSLREVIKIMKMLKNDALKDTSVFLVLNQKSSPTFNAISQEQVEKHLQVKLDIVIKFDKKLEQAITAGKSIDDSGLIKQPGISFLKNAILGIKSNEHKCMKASLKSAFLKLKKD